MRPIEPPAPARPRRRRFLIGLAAAGAAGAGGAAWWLHGDPAPVAGLPTLGAAQAWIESLALSEHAHTTAGWPLAQVLEHAAQSIEYSLDGYPQAKPAWFQRSVGAFAFAVFDRRGAMRHGLEEPIPGAPALAALDTADSARRLLAALERFERHRGALAPHFAYGALGHAAYTRAHLMHLADHARWIDPAPAG